MKPLTQEWVVKAEGDFITATRELAVEEDPNYDAVCFHTQQCAEKYLKAFLQEEDSPFGKTHNLTDLLDQLLPFEPTWEVLRSELRGLTLYAVDYRYPGLFADKVEASEALTICQQVRDLARGRLGLAS